MNNLKKFMALILSAAMVISLSACNIKIGKSKTEETTTAESDYEYDSENDYSQKEDADDDNDDKSYEEEKDDEEISNKGNKATEKNSAEKVTKADDTKSSKQNIYDEYANKIKETGKNGYYLYDMDGNGVPELFVDEGRMFSVYSYKSSVQKIGEVESYRSTLYVAESGNGLTLNRSKEDKTNLYHLTLNKGQIKQEIFLDASSSEGTMDDDKEQKIKDNCKSALANGSGSASGADSDLTMLKEVVMNGSKTANIDG